MTLRLVLLRVIRVPEFELASGSVPEAEGKLKCDWGTSSKIDREFPKADAAGGAGTGPLKENPAKGLGPPDPSWAEMPSLLSLAPDIAEPKVKVVAPMFGPKLKPPLVAAVAVEGAVVVVLGNPKEAWVVFVKENDPVVFGPAACDDAAWAALVEENNTAVLGPAACDVAGAADPVSTTRTSMGAAGFWWWNAPVSTTEAAVSAPNKKFVGAEDDGNALGVAGKGCCC